MNNWKILGERIDAKCIRRAIRDALEGKRRFLRIGRSTNSAGFSSGTPIEIVDGDQPPELDGYPYLSTTFRNGSFTKNLYTSSTLRVIVGREWINKIR